MYYTRMPLYHRERTGDPVPRRGDSRGRAGGLFACAPGGANDYVNHQHHDPADVGGAPPRRGGPELANDDRWRDQARLQEDPEALGTIRETIEAWTMQREKFEVMEILAPAGVPVGPVMHSGDIYDNEHLRERGC